MHMVQYSGHMVQYSGHMEQYFYPEMNNKLLLFLLPSTLFCFKKRCGWRKHSQGCSSHLSKSLLIKVALHEEKEEVSSENIKYKLFPPDI